MKIATWNLESINRLTPDRRDAILGAVKDVDADVWVLTESWVNLEPLPGYRLVSHSCKADEDLTPERRWVSIWARSNLTSSALEVKSQQQDRMAAVQIMKPDGDNLVVVGTVLPWPSDKLWPGVEGFCKALAEQAAEWKRLKNLPDTGTFLVAGDFNQAIPYQRWFGSKKGANALEDQDWVCLTRGNDPLTAKPRIDHICISRRGLKPPFLPQVGAWEVPLHNGKPVTDHSGAVADLDLLSAP